MQSRNAPMRLLAATVALLLPLSAAAQDEDDPFEDLVEESEGEGLFEEETEPDWIPSFRIGAAVNTQFADGFVEAIDIGHTADQTLIASFSKADDNPVDGPSVNAGFELMGPPVIAGIRPFVLLGITNQLEGRGAIAKEQSTEELKLTAKRLRIDISQDQFWYAGLGIAIPLPIDDYNIKLKPSISYSEVTGSVSGSLTEALIGGPSRDESFPFLLSRETKPFKNRGLTTRLEVDAEVYREGPISVGFYLAIQLMLILDGDLSEALFVPGCKNRVPECDPALLETAPFIDPTHPTGLTHGGAEFSLKRNRAVLQGGAGIRISWMGY